MNAPIAVESPTEFAAKAAPRTKNPMTNESELESPRRSRDSMTRGAMNRLTAMMSTIAPTVKKIASAEMETGASSVLFGLRIGMRARRGTTARSCTIKIATAVRPIFEFNSPRLRSVCSTSAVEDIASIKPVISAPDQYFEVGKTSADKTIPVSTICNMPNSKSLGHDFPILAGCNSSPTRKRKKITAMSAMLLLIPEASIRSKPLGPIRIPPARRPRMLPKCMRFEMTRHGITKINSRQISLRSVCISAQESTCSCKNRPHECGQFGTVHCHDANTYNGF